MTVEQADDINTLFTQYNDSIKVLNDKIWRLGYDVRFADKQIQALDGTLSEVKTDNSIKDKQIIQYKKEIERVQKLEWIDKKARVRVGIGIGAAIVTWLALVITSK